jgi:hypothetical protein
VCRMPFVVALAWGLMGMQQNFFMGRVSQGKVLAWVVAVAAVLLVCVVLAAAPARAQATGVVVDLAVDPQPRACGTGDCLPGERPVTFEATLTVNEQASQQTLTAPQVTAANDALANQAVEITLTPATGTAQTVEEGAPICLEPGRYTIAATLVDEAAAIRAVVNAANRAGPPRIRPQDVTIESSGNTFDVARCNTDGDGVTAAKVQYKDKIINIPDQKTLADTGGISISYGLIGVVLLGVGVPLFWWVIRRAY